MSNIVWTLKQWFRNLVPLLVVSGVLYFGYSMYEQGAFRRGLKPAFVRVMSKLPVFGSQFRRMTSSRSSVAVSRRYRSHRKFRGHHSRRHGRRYR